MKEETVIINGKTYKLVPDKKEKYKELIEKRRAVLLDKFGSFLVKISKFLYGSCLCEKN